MPHTHLALLQHRHLLYLRPSGQNKLLRKYTKHTFVEEKLLNQCNTDGIKSKVPEIEPSGELR